MQALVHGLDDLEHIPKGADKMLFRENLFCIKAAIQHGLKKTACAKKAQKRSELKECKVIKGCTRRCSHLRVQLGPFNRSRQELLFLLFLFLLFVVPAPETSGVCDGCAIDESMCVCVCVYVCMCVCVYVCMCVCVCMCV